MSNEEREALEILKGFEPDDLVECAIYLQAMEKITNLIEKQSKEIEHQKEKRANQRNELAILNAKQIEFNKLVNTVNSYKGQFKRQQKEIEELKDMKKELTERVLRLESDKFWDNVVSKDKIKAKIEFIKSLKEKIYYEENVISVLQSLLEKE